jgi:adenylate cyclase, class 2
MRKRETEIKLPVTNSTAIRKRLAAIGLVQVHRRCLEDNHLFDTPDRVLRKNRSVLRLRRYGNECRVTFKGTPEDDRLYKTRIELESVVDDSEAIRLVFEALGFHPAFRYQKYRTVFAPVNAKGKRGPPCEAALDETPIGAFVELEGTRRWIDRVARELGYKREDYSTASYGALFIEYCRQRNMAPGDMLFPAAARNGRTRPNGRQRTSNVILPKKIARQTETP